MELEEVRVGWSNVREERGWNSVPVNGVGAGAFKKTKPLVKESEENGKT